MKFKVKWETTVSISRPFYHGEDVIFAFNKEVLIEKAKKDIARNNGFHPSEIVILDFKEVN